MAVDVTAYLQEMIGRPWERHGLHCWALVEDAQARLFDRTVPAGPADVPKRLARTALISDSPEKYGWEEVRWPIHGAVARLSRVGGNINDAEHAGVYLSLQGGRILHSDIGHGVVLDSLVELRVRGWVPRFYIPSPTA